MSTEQQERLNRLIAAIIESHGRSMRSIAREVPISDTRLRQWLTGVDAKGEEVPFPAARLARVAQILDLDDSTLRVHGREDAAKILATLREEDAAAKLAQGLDTVEIARRLESMAKRIGELAQENEELRDRIDELEAD